MTDTNEKQPLTVEMAQRMYSKGKGLPEESKEEVRARYEAMAVEARTVIAERLEQYATSVARICVEKKHVGSTQPSRIGDTGTPCPQCRKQVRYMKSATKIVAPAAGD